MLESGERLCNGLALSLAQGQRRGADKKLGKTGNKEGWSLIRLATQRLLRQQRRSMWERKKAKGLSGVFAFLKGSVRGECFVTTVDFVPYGRSKCISLTSATQKPLKGYCGRWSLCRRHKRVLKRLWRALIGRG